MNVFLERTGNPWMDWGIVAMHHFLVQQEEYVLQVNLTDSYVHFELPADLDSEDFISVMEQYLRAQMARLVLPDLALKALGMSVPKRSDGLPDPRYTCRLSKEQLTLVREKPRLKKTQPNLKASLSRNYVGLKGDFDTLAAELENAIRAFWQQQTEKPSAKAMPCPLCGRALWPLSFKMLQNRNPLFNKHQNLRPRGYFGSAENPTMCPTCNLLNIFSVCHNYLPYFTDKSTCILVPGTNSLQVLSKVFQAQKIRLKDMTGADVYSYTTNIDLLRNQAPYQALLAVYTALMNRYAPAEKGYVQDPALGQEEQRGLSCWYLIRVSKGQHVTVGAVNTVFVSTRLFELVRSLDYGRNSDRRGNISETFFARVSSGKEQSVECLAQGLVEEDWSVFSRALFGLLKETRRPRNSVRMAPWSLVFFDHFCDFVLKEVDKVLSSELIDDLKTVGKVIGYNFPGDIGLFSNLNNIYDAETFSKALREVLFKLQKKAATNKKGDKETEIRVPGEGRIENILRNLQEQNIQPMKDVLLIFASLQALYRLTAKSKAEKESTEIG